MKESRKQPLIIRVGKAGSWYAKQDGQHLTAQETASLIAKGIHYKFVDV